MDDKPPKPILRINPRAFEPAQDPLHEQWYRAVHEGHKTTTWWGRLLERLRFGRAARRGIIFVPSTDAANCQLVTPGKTFGPMPEDPYAPRPLVDVDGYRDFLRTLPDLTVKQVLEANEAAQLVALVGIADPEQRAGFWLKIRWRWWWRRLRRRLGFTSRPRPHGRLQRTRADFPAD
jgi:hypothetical protein